MMARPPPLVLQVGGNDESKRWRVAASKQLQSQQQEHCPPLQPINAPLPRCVAIIRLAQQQRAGGRVTDKRNGLVPTSSSSSLHNVTATHGTNKEQGHSVNWQMRMKNSRKFIMQYH